MLLKEQVNTALNAEVSEEELLGLLEYIVSQAKQKRREKTAELNAKLFPLPKGELVTSTSYLP